MNYPSIKRIEQDLKLTRDKAKQIRSIMTGDKRIDGQTRMERIDAVLGTHGVESIPAGHNAKSPAIAYCNTGDSFGWTILKIDGRFSIGSWGDIVERGNYD